MPQGENYGIWDEEHQTFTFHSKYNIDKFTPLIECHAEEGGLFTSPVLAGVLKVSRQTILDWKNPNHAQYHEGFKALIDRNIDITASTTDKWHRESASGKNKDANAATLNRRAESLLNLTEKKEQKITHSTDYSLDELKARINEVELEIDDESTTD